MWGWLQRSFLTESIFVSLSLPPPPFSLSLLYLHSLSLYRPPSLSPAKCALHSSHLHSGHRRGRENWSRSCCSKLCDRYCPHLSRYTVPFPFSHDSMISCCMRSFRTAECTTRCHQDVVFTCQTFAGLSESC